MDVGSLEQLKRVWSNPSVPVLYRRGAGNPLLARLPYASTNRSWLWESGRKRPVWLTSKKYWELPQAWFSDLVKRCLDKYGQVYIIQPFRAQEKCAPACWNAEGEICECSCMGANHGSSHPGGRWKIVSETFATRWGERELACRLLTWAS
jgi:hypothetical protein